METGSVEQIPFSGAGSHKNGEEVVRLYGPRRWIIVLKRDKISHFPLRRLQTNFLIL
jgi:hypothetical protein